MAPVLLVATALTAIVTAAGSILFGGRWWGYWPAHVWARLFCLLTFVRVTVTGREHISSGTSYVFVANHQSAYDIFTIYGYLNHNFKWMMKKSLEKIPLVGYSCKRSGHIMVDRSTPQAIRQTIENAERQLKDGMSLVVFPEGSRTLTGKTGRFKRGAFMLASEFNLPIVPVTIDGAYEVMSRKSKMPHWGHITLTIHPPVPAPESEHCQDLIDSIRDTIVSSLPPTHRDK
ncbi:MAG: 1-acyl-sn-glycerol-3-phosphate acyltransferase [Muribaculaceae bacterium]|nr:1-acyl-sn-glycerol-3-phosphate acyltransferase [Muribaculaceae bacterium]MDE6343355.1 1-acyl-sn-glycerol-3-phosphate acyltransferase [Muribaculaceae bacterium]